MRPTSFDPSLLRQHLHRHIMADLRKLERILGTAALRLLCEHRLG